MGDAFVHLHSFTCKSNHNAKRSPVESVGFPSCTLDWVVRPSDHSLAAAYVSARSLALSIDAAMVDIGLLSNDLWRRHTRRN